MHKYICAYFLFFDRMISGLQSTYSLLTYAFVKVESLPLKVSTILESTLYV